jgi:hypothetical protein
MSGKIAKKCRRWDMYKIYVSTMVTVIAFVLIIIMYMISLWSDVFMQEFKNVIKELHPNTMKEFVKNKNNETE